MVIEENGISGTGQSDPSKLTKSKNGAVIDSKTNAGNSEMTIAYTDPFLVGRR